MNATVINDFLAECDELLTAAEISAAHIDDVMKTHRPVSERWNVDTILDALNNYAGADIWNDVIWALDNYDETQTELVDPCQRGAAFATHDGRVFEWIAGADYWTVSTTWEMN